MAGDEALRLLVVDDEPTNVQIVTALLTHAGFSCESAKDGEEALTRLQGEHGFAAVLMDLQMPKLDGFAATERLRFQEARDGTLRVPVFAMTAHSVPDALSRVDAVGMDGLLTKPVRLGVLLATLANCGIARPGSESGEARPSLVPRKQVLDRATIERLRRMQGERRPTFMRDLVATFESSAGALQQTLHAGVAAADHTRVKDAAHALKGASRNVGASRLSSLCADLEQSAGSGGSLVEFLEPIDKELGRVLGALAAEVAD